MDHDQGAEELSKEITASLPPDLHHDRVLEVGTPPDSEKERNHVHPRFMEQAAPIRRPPEATEPFLKIPFD